MIGRESCFILDFAFNMGGSEALAETYFGVMKHQFKDNSSSETADLRTLIDFCYPDVSKCPKAITEISKIYIKGDIQKKAAPHRQPVFLDSRARTANKYNVSKAIDKERKKQTGCLYIN